MLGSLQIDPSIHHILGRVDASHPPPTALINSIHIQNGDVLAIVTDDLTEVFDDPNQELGDHHVVVALKRFSSLPLSQIAGEIHRSKGLLEDRR